MENKTRDLKYIKKKVKIMKKFFAFGLLSLGILNAMEKKSPNDPLVELMQQLGKLAVQKGMPEEELKEGEALLQEVFQDGSLNLIMIDLSHDLIEQGRSADAEKILQTIADKEKYSHDGIIARVSLEYARISQKKTFEKDLELERQLLLLGDKEVQHLHEENKGKNEILKVLEILELPKEEAIKKIMEEFH